MIVVQKSNATLPSARAPKPGRHRLREGVTLPGSDIRIGATPSMWVVGNVLGRHGRKVEPITRRAAE